MRNLKRIPQAPGAPSIIRVVIEIPQGSKNKFEYDETDDLIKLDRVLHSAVYYPVAYGFIPGTLWDDGDPLDALVLIDEALFPGVVLEVRPVGVLRMEDDKGSDDKILTVAIGDPRYAGCHDLPEIQKHLLVEIEHFFQSYKELEGKKVKSYGWRPATDALQAIRKGMAMASGRRRVKGGSASGRKARGGGLKRRPRAKNRPS